jgi:DnaK suppressor protein
MTKRDLEDIKRILLAERERAEASLRRTTLHAQSEPDDSTKDSGDLASASHDRDVLYRLQESDLKRLRLISEVLSRIDTDGYGVCEQCGEEIGKARLAAIPWATTCLICQQKADLQDTLSRAEDHYGHKESHAA